MRPVEERTKLLFLLADAASDHLPRRSVPEEQTAYLHAAAVGHRDAAVGGSVLGYVNHSLSGDGSQSRIGGQVDVERIGCGICHHTGNTLLLEVNLVRADCAAGRWHGCVGVNFNPLTLVDGGCVEGEGGARQAAA